MYLIQNTHKQVKPGIDALMEKSMLYPTRNIGARKREKQAAQKTGLLLNLVPITKA